MRVLRRSSSGWALLLCLCLLFSLAAGAALPPGKRQEKDVAVSDEPSPTPTHAGTILLITGLMHCLLGVRAKRLQTFFSAAFLASLGTTVLILYLMTPPVTPAVQGQFWAWVWRLNERLFPEEAVTYPLTRGIRVELAVTVILFVLGIVSQMRLWRLIRERRNKRVSEEESEEEVVVEDEEEAVGRQVEEVTERERREWERVYGDGGSVHTEPRDSGVGEMENEKQGGASKRTSATTLNEGQAPAELSSEGAETTEKKSAGITEDEADRRVTVRVISDHGPEGILADALVAGGKGKESTSKSSASTIRSSHSSAEPAIVPLPFKIPTAKNEETEAAADDDDGSSVAAVADDEEDSPKAVDEGMNAEAAARLSRHSMYQEGQTDVAAERYETLAQLIGKRMDDSDSMIATLDDESSNGDAETAILDWSRQENGEPAETKTEGKKGAEAKDQQKTTTQGTEISAKDATSNVNSPVPGEQSQSLEGAESPAEKSTPVQSQDAVPAPEAAPTKDVADAPKDRGSESTESFRTVLARLTKSNLPAALPEVALTYRTNEWAKHLSLADMPEPDAVKVPEPVSEEPAHLDVCGLQQTAENGAPPPAISRPSSAMANPIPPPPALRSVSRASLSGSEVCTPAAPSQDLQPGTKFAPYRSASMMKRQSSTVLPEPIAEEADGEPQGVNNQAALQVPGPAYASHRIMRENLLRSRASGIFIHHPTESTAGTYAPSDAGSIRNYQLQPRAPTRGAPRPTRPLPTSTWTTFPSPTAVPSCVKAAFPSPTTTITPPPTL
ncbi:hypothetical protein N0V88_005835 [Collariella sp. IMI 366227]|nr:hypothetical protein N0V88_005835 [Collariella sp. IMI 366227]